MASYRETFEKPKTLEILGGFFGYFAVAKDVPDIFRTLCLKKIFPTPLSARLIAWNPRSDFWYLVLFSVLVVLLVFWGVPKKSREDEKNSDDDIQRAVAAMERAQFIRVLRSFGLVWIRERILDLVGVSTYGTFLRGSNWPTEPGRFNYVDRINFSDGNGFEVQYSRNFNCTYIRTHPNGNASYGPSFERMPEFHEARALVFASNFFPIWFLGFLLSRPIVGVKRWLGF